jgi:hypothetical protein
VSQISHGFLFNQKGLASLVAKKGKAVAGPIRTLFFFNCSVSLAAKPSCRYIFALFERDFLHTCFPVINY